MKKKGTLLLLYSMAALATFTFFYHSLSIFYRKQIDQADHWMVR